MVKLKRAATNGVEVRNRRRYSTVTQMRFKAFVDISSVTRRPELLFQIVAFTIVLAHARLSCTKSVLCGIIQWLLPLERQYLHFH